MATLDKEVILLLKNTEKLVISIKSLFHDGNLVNIFNSSR